MEESSKGALQSRGSIGEGQHREKRAHIVQKFRERMWKMGAENAWDQNQSGTKLGLGRQWQGKGEPGGGHSSAIPLPKVQETLLHTYTHTHRQDISILKFNTD